ncbi:hypothetical protein [Corynebacterium sp. 335C]
MPFPYDEMDPGEEVLLDVNPVFTDLVRPMVELAVITGVIWLLVGFIDGPYIGDGDLRGLRAMLLTAWPLLLAWRVGAPVLGWLGRRLVVTDRRLILRRGIVRPDIVVVDLRSVRGVGRRGSVLEVSTGPWRPPLVIEGVPGSRRVARVIAGR